MSKRVLKDIIDYATFIAIIYPVLVATTVIVINTTSPEDTAGSVIGRLLIDSHMSFHVRSTLMYLITLLNVTINIFIGKVYYGWKEYIDQKHNSLIIWFIVTSVIILFEILLSTILFNGI